MLVKTSNTTYVVKFFHVNPDFYNVENVRPGTMCLVSDLNGDEADTLVGDAFLKIVKHPTENNKSDHFNKAIGRKTALANAIKPLPREVRKLFWAEYWKQHAS